MVLAVALVSSRARAEEQQSFQVSAGYSHFSLGGDDFADDFGGWGMAARWRASFLEDMPNLMLGASLQLTFFDGNDSVAGSFGGLSVNESISDVDVFSPTFDLAWNQPLGGGFFVEPSIGVGWAWGTFDPVVAAGGNRTEDGGVVRPGVAIGYGQDHWSVGLDFQYSFYWIDFSSSVSGTTISDLDDVHEEIYAGFFFRYAF
jgi:hypothetical protein